jgi:hypothetical protein
VTLTVLFWNIRRNARVKGLLAELAAEHSVDVLAVAERGELTGPAIAAEVTQRIGCPFHDVRTRAWGLAVCAAGSPGWVLPLKEEDKYSILTVATESAPELLLALAHLKAPSPQTGQRAERHRALAAGAFAQKIREAEAERGHLRTVVVGDLNFNPYDHPIAGVDGLHAAPAWDVMEGGKDRRKVDGKEHVLFYNPMWSHYGDRTPGPPGTYHDWRHGGDTCFWYMWDQVLVRHALRASLEAGRVAILDRAGGTSLVTAAGFPWRKEYSDHLPVLLRLELG